MRISKVEGSIPAVPMIFFRCAFFFHLFFWRRVVSQPSTSIGPEILYGVLCDVYTWHVFIRRVLLPLLLLCVAILLLLQHLLQFVIVCRMAKFVAGSLELIPVFSLFIRARFIFNAPRGNTVAFTHFTVPLSSTVAFLRIYGLDLPILHPR